jgi:hypothetical protein
MGRSAPEQRAQTQRWIQRHSWIPLINKTAKREAVVKAGFVF